METQFCGFGGLHVRSFTVIPLLVLDWVGPFQSRREVACDRTVDVLRDGDLDVVDAPIRGFVADQLRLAQRRPYTAGEPKG